MVPARRRSSEAGDLLPAADDEVVRTLATAGFAALWRAEAARPSDLVPDAPDKAGAVAAALARQGRAELDADGRLIGIHGLTLRASRHRIDHDGLTHQTWCAFDAIGIPAALRLTATAHTDCPVCGTPLTVAITEGVAVRDTALLWLPASSGRNLLADFCAKADLYCGRTHVESAASPGRVIDVSTAADLGRTTWAAVRPVGIAGVLHGRAGTERHA